MHATICDIIIDCLQNAVEADAGKIDLTVKQSLSEITVEIKDNGKGMDKETVKKAQDPFYTDGHKHAKRKVGLGLPFLSQTTAQAGGFFSLESEPGQGTLLRFGFDPANIDTPPPGRLADAFLSCFMFGGDFELTVRRFLKQGDKTIHYEIKRSELIEALGGLEDSECLLLARQYLRSLEEE